MDFHEILDSIKEKVSSLIQKVREFYEENKMLSLIIAGLVALLFATYQVRPSPFCLLDEIDAALDDKNVSSFVTALESFASVSQYIVITHNKKTVMGASTMLGITMEESGVSKIIALRLDEDIKRGAIVDHNQDNFVDEDVPDEEGVVLPPRPPKRDKS